MKIDAFLPQCKPILLKVMIIIITCLFLYISVNYLLFAFHGKFDLIMLIIGVCFLMLSWGLYRMRKWARSTVTVLFLIAAIVLPLGAITPFSAMELAAHGQPVPEWYMLLLLPIMPITLLLLFCVHLLGKYKSEFK